MVEDFFIVLLCDSSFIYFVRQSEGYLALLHGSRIRSVPEGFLQVSARYGKLPWHMGNVERNGSRALD
jgi:hypothetical protein